jgi:hypothetical protein
MATTSRKFYLTDGGVLTFGLTITSATTPEQIISMVKNKVPDKSVSYVLDADNDMVALDALFNTTPNTKDTPYKIGFDDSMKENDFGSFLPCCEPAKKRPRIIRQSSHQAFNASALAKRFALGKCLSNGYTDVFAAHDNETGMAVVVKIASILPASNSHLRLHKEYIVLSGDLEKCSHVPKVLIFLESSSHMYLVETPLGQTLDDYLEQFSSVDVGKILVAWTVKLVEYLHNIHKCGIIHRDIKPENIMIVPQTGELYYLDLDLAIVTVEGVAKYNSGFSGTAKFASANQLNGGTPCFGDDFESLCYSLYNLENKKDLKQKRPSFSKMKQCSAIVKLACATWEDITKRRI